MRTIVIGYRQCCELPMLPCLEDDDRGRSQTKKERKQAWSCTEDSMSVPGIMRSSSKEERIRGQTQSGVVENEKGNSAHDSRDQCVVVVLPLFSKLSISLGSCNGLSIEESRIVFWNALSTIALSSIVSGS